MAESENHNIYFLRMKLECIIKMHICVDKTIQKFDDAGIAPRMEDLDNLKNMKGIQLELSSELKIYLEAIRAEILSLEKRGFYLDSISQGTISWEEKFHDSTKKFKWSYKTNILTYKEKTTC